MSVSKSLNSILLATVFLALFACVGCSKSKRTAKPVAPAPASEAPDATTPPASAEDASEADLPEEDVLSETALTPQASLENAATTLEHAGPEEAQATEVPSVPEGSWTERRLIVLAPGGPVLIDLSVSVGAKSLEAASDEILAEVAAELLPDGAATTTWNALLEHPTIRSGWLGNLVAEDEQREQLISMYDTSKDGNVDVAELPAFLSRGLSRNAALQLSDAGNAADVDINTSPWGTADLDNDYSLGADELAGMENIIRRLDLNGDSAVTVQELTSAGGMQMQTEGISSRSMLETSSVVFSEAPSAATASSDETLKDSLRERRRRATSVLRHYTFLESLSRDQWPDWSDQLWASLDSDHNQYIDKSEVEQLFSIDSQVRMFVGLSAADDADGNRVQQIIFGPDMDGAWSENDEGGHLLTRNCSTILTVDDAFDRTGRQLLRNRLNLALGNAQLRAFFTNQLQLSEDAFEIIDGDGDKKLDDKEFNQVWKWLAVRQGTRLLARWEISGSPWYQLADENGDSRLTEVELAKLADKLRGLDRNQDMSITPNELPLVARLRLSRNDSRLAASPFDIPDRGSTETDVDWFAAMDTNRDGVLNRSEFLGSKADFVQLDTDKDGFVSRKEVVAAP